MQNYAISNIPQIWEKGGHYAIDSEKSIAGLMKMATSEKNICFTYSAQSYADASKMGKVSKEILSFDWTGKKVKKYILPLAQFVWIMITSMVFVTWVMRRLYIVLNYNADAELSTETICCMTKGRLGC